MSWWEWVEQVSGKSVPTQIAQEVGINQSAVNRWSHGGSPSAESAMKTARRYKKPVLEALIAAELLTAEEARQRPSASPDLSTLSDEALLEQIRRRIEGLRNDVEKMRAASGGVPAGKPEPGAAPEEGAMPEDPVGRKSLKPRKRAESPARLKDS